MDLQLLGLVVFTLWVLSVDQGGLGVAGQSQYSTIEGKIYAWKKITQTQNIKIPVVCEMSSFVYKDNLYWIGGYDEATGNRYNDLYKFDTTTELWSIVTTTSPTNNFPVKHQTIPIYVQGNKVYYQGVSVSSQYQYLVLDMDTLVWSRATFDTTGAVQSKNRLLGWMTKAEVNSKFYTFGGYDSTNGGDARFITRYDPSTGLYEGDVVPKCADGTAFAWDAKEPNHFTPAYSEKIKFKSTYANTVWNAGQNLNYHKLYVDSGLTSTQVKTQFASVKKTSVDAQAAIHGVISTVETIMTQNLTDAEKVAEIMASLNTTYGVTTPDLSLPTGFEECGALFQCREAPGCTIPANSEFGAAVGVGDFFVMHGGYTCLLKAKAPQGNLCHNAHFYVFDTVKGIWHKQHLNNSEVNTTMARAWHSMLKNSDSEFLIFGGCHFGEGVDYFNDVVRVEMYNETTFSWNAFRVRGTPPPKRRGNVFQRIGNKYFVFGGCRPPNVFLNDTWVMYEVFPDAAKTEATPDIGQQSFLVGKEYSVQVQVKDANSTNITFGLDSISLTGFAQTTTGFIAGRVTDNLNGSYSIAFSTTVADDYSINIMYEGSHIKGSPWNVTFSSEIARAQNSFLENFNIGFSGANSSFKVTFRDIYGNIAAEPADFFVEFIETAQASLNNNNSSNTNSTNSTGSNNRTTSGVTHHSIYRRAVGDPINVTLTRNATSTGIQYIFETPDVPFQLTGGFGSEPLGYPDGTSNANGDQYSYTPLPPPSSSSSLSLTVIIAIVVVVVVFIVAIALVIRWYRKKKAFERELMKTFWVVNWEDVEVSTENNMKSMLSMGSQLSHNSHNSKGSDHSKGTANETETIKSGLYQDKRIAMKFVHIEDFDITIPLLKEFYKLHEMSNPNVNQWIGICRDSPEFGGFYMCTLYASKGSLSDVLESDKIKLDWLFKFTIAVDCSKGMQFIHQVVGSHGRLKSSNCVVDSRWTLKLTDFGLYDLMEMEERDEDYYESYQYYKSLLWTAPELLVEPQGRRGTKAGDVFSYGIILSELINREPPYADLCMEPIEIIEGLRDESILPAVPDGNCPEELKPVIESCWEAEEERPSFEQVYRRVQRVNPHRNVNILDNMSKMLENYTQNLEGIIMERTSELNEEKQKTDELLYRMLPHFVAEKIKAGEVVKPVEFENCSMFFSDVVGFTSIAGRSKPMEIVDLLNDLYVTFDNILDMYDVYKVETIGDAYMVVSGIPIPNEDRHYGQIALMSLHLNSEIRNMKIRHLPDVKLRLRIGIHSGPAVAGIVGVKMPRYCLFGDTVQIASKMESEGVPQRVQCSAPLAMGLRRDGGYELQYRMEMELKGLGTWHTYFVDDCNNLELEQPRPSIMDDRLDQPLPEPEHLRTATLEIVQQSEHPTNKEKELTSLQESGDDVSEGALDEEGSVKDASIEGGLVEEELAEEKTTDKDPPQEEPVKEEPVEEEPANEQSTEEEPTEEEAVEEEPVDEKSLHVDSVEEKPTEEEPTREGSSGDMEKGPIKRELSQRDERSSPEQGPREEHSAQEGAHTQERDTSDADSSCKLDETEGDKDLEPSETARSSKSGSSASEIIDHNEEFQNQPAKRETPNGKHQQHNMDDTVNSPKLEREKEIDDEKEKRRLIKVQEKHEREMKRKELKKQLLEDNETNEEKKEEIEKKLKEENEAKLERKRLRQEKREKKRLILQRRQEKLEGRQSQSP
eukprot:Nk52_evm90s1073 gene=Nk52_evmTU90s1073